MEPQRTPAILVLLASARNRVARIERQQSEICARGPLLEKDAAGTGEPGGTVDRAEYSVAMTALLGELSSASLRLLFPGPCLRPRQPRDVVRDRSAGLAPVAGPDHLRSIRRWRGVGLAVIVALGIASLGDASSLAAPVDPERDNLLVEWRI